jgi:chaperonin GroES
MAIRPLHDRVLVKPLESETKTTGGIIIPETAQEKPQEGKVVAAGPGKKADDGSVTPMDVKKGDRVLYSKWAGTEVKVKNETLMIMNESDIMGVLG